MVGTALVKVPVQRSILDEV